MPEQEPQIRVHNFAEVPIGYSAETAIAEAKRLYPSARNQSVSPAVPLTFKIPEFVRDIAEGNFIEGRPEIKRNQTAFRLYADASARRKISAKNYAF